eukprot:251527_1
MSSPNKLPLYEISGTTPYEIGFNYGITLKERIQSTVNVYYNWFIDMGGTDTILEQQCKEYELLINKECPSICQEINGISKGSQVPLWKIYLLNCRTEIYNMLEVNLNNETDGPTECSGIMNVSHNINAQNWDWSENMHDNAILLRIKKPSNTILMLIEPGMVGKIGLNANGISCTLFLLRQPKFYKHKSNIQKGIPIHVILRLFLECKTMNEIDTLLNNMTVNTYSCIGVADSNKNGYYLEFCGYNTYEKLYASKKQFSFHTNHYLGCGLEYIGKDEATSCSLPRYKQMRSLYDYRKCKNNNKFDNRIEVIEEILTNNMHHKFPICRKFVYRKKMNAYIGTIATIIMDLKQKSMKISRGTPLKYPFDTIFVNSIPSKL